MRGMKIRLLSPKGEPKSDIQTPPTPTESSAPCLHRFRAHKGITIDGVHCIVHCVPPLLIIARVLHLPEKI